MLTSEFLHWYFALVSGYDNYLKRVLFRLITVLAVHEQKNSCEQKAFGHKPSDLDVIFAQPEMVLVLQPRLDAEGLISILKCLQTHGFLPFLV